MDPNPELIELVAALLLARLSQRKGGTLRFTTDFTVPFALKALTTLPDNLVMAPTG